MIRRFVSREIVHSAFAWRWARNPRRTLRQGIESRGGEGPQLEHDVEVLRAEGIVMRPADQVFDANGLQQLEKVVASAHARMDEQDVRATLANPGSFVTKKDYRIHLVSRQFDVDSPLIQLAIHPALLARVNGYLGMWSYLREVQIWLDMPTPGEAKETQLWHRDDDDYANIKAFIYLNAVTEGGGPFCFVPRTHVFGTLRNAVPPTAPGRMDDTQMAGYAPAAGWTRCTGAPGTVILADTTGFHRGLKPQAQHRVLVSLHYTSGTPRYPRNFELRLAPGAGLQLEAVQKYALFA
jgi:Phytanoyl-CoA dioxygenase (PhyH)